MSLDVYWIVGNSGFLGGWVRGNEPELGNGLYNRLVFSGQFWVGAVTILHEGNLGA